MAIKLSCPRCKQTLLVPGKLAGTYARCPGCNGRFWVPKEALNEGPDTSTVMTVPQPGMPPPAPPQASHAPQPPAPPPPPLPPMPPAAPGMPAMSTAAAAMVSSPPVAAKPPGGSGSYPAVSAAGAMPGVAPAPRPAAGQVPAMRIAPAPPPPTLRPAAPGKKVARFITAEAAQSALPLAADGRLPDLQLSESQEKQKPGAKTKSVHPLVLVAAIAGSVLFSMLMVFWDPSEGQLTSTQEDQARARQNIEENYFVAEGRDALQPYQRVLREAQQAHTRGDRRSERELYRQVLQRIRAERGPFDKGLTGSHDRDKKLEQQITILLNEN